MTIVGVPIRGGIGGMSRGHGPSSIRGVTATPSLDS